MFNDSRSGVALRYGFGLAALLSAFGLRFLLQDWFPPGFPYVTFFPAVVITAYVAGVRPAAAVAAAGMLLAWYFFIPPYGTFDLSGSTAMALGFYVFVVAVDIFFINGMREALIQLQAEQARSARLHEAKELLAREMHHRISNNIQVVGSLLRLQTDGVTDPKARRALSEAGQRIELIANIQRQLNAQDGAAVPFHQFARGFLEDAAKAAGRKVAIEILGGEEPLSTDQATPVSLVLLECFNNVLEHGVGPEGGVVVVEMAEVEDEQRLTITDNGRGPPEGFALGSGGSLGLRIVRGMAKQIQGRFSIERRGGLTVCTLSFPQPN